MPSGLQTSAKTWGCGQGWRHLRDRLNCPRQSLLQQVSTPPTSSPKTWLCPSTWNMMLQFSSWHLKKKKVSQLKYLLPVWSQKRSCFLKKVKLLLFSPNVKCFTGGRGWKRQAAPIQICDNMRKSSKAPNQDSSCRKGNEKRTEISSECVLLSPRGSFWHKVYRSEGSPNFQTTWTSKQKSAWAGSLKGSWPRVLQGSMAFEVSVWMVSGSDSAGETLV